MLNDQKTLLLTIAVGLSFLLFCSCSSRSFTKPRSVIIAEARSDGIAIPTLEEERQRFFAVERTNAKRLQALLSKRQGTQRRTGNYRLGSGDEVEINVFDVPELNVTAKVSEAGFVPLPLVGAVLAAGLTETEFQSELSNRLSRYVRKPQVNVFVTHYGSQKVSVLGAVNSPGSYALKKNRNNIIELISQAGGLSERAGNYLNFVPVEIVSNSRSDRSYYSRVYKAQAANPSGLEVPLVNVLGTGGQVPVEIPVRGGDMIIIPEAGKVSVEGEVQATGIYELGQRMTLLGSLAAAGGITYGAKIDEIEVVRHVNGLERARLVLNLEKILSGDEQDVLLRDGDLVRVPSDGARRLRQDTFESIAKIMNVGVGGSVNLAN